MSRSAQISDIEGGAPGEEEFVVPEGWGDRVHPRRGGIPGPPPVIDTRAAGALRRRLEKVRPAVDEALDHKASDKEMAAAARAHLGGEPDPMGAAVVASLLWSLTGWDEEKCERFADAWVTEHDLVFATRATAELSRVLVGYVSGKGRKKGGHRVQVLDDDSSASGFEDVEGAAHRMRELLANAGEEEYRRCVAALADHRICHYQRVVVSYLVPERTAWTDELVATRLSVGHARLSPLLVGALASAEQLALLRERQSDAWLGIPKLAHTVAEGVGAALTPTLLDLLDEGRVRAPEELRNVLDVLATMPGDAALDALVTRLDRPGAHAAARAAMERFPQRALRRLAANAPGGSRRARLAKQLLRDHVDAHPEVLESVRPELPDELHRTIRRVMRTATRRTDDAPADALPRVLLEPPEGVTHVAKIDEYLLPQLLLRGRRQALPLPAVRNLVALLAAAKRGDGEGGEAGGPASEVVAGVDAVRELCDPASLDEFVWALFRQTAEEPGWALAALGRLGGDETARELTRFIRSLQRRRARRAVAALDTLVEIGTDVAHMHVAGIARTSRFPSVRKAAWERIDRVAAARGLTPEQFADGFVPDFGLDPDGTLTLDYGRRRFTAGFDEQLRPFVTDEDGGRRANLPRPGIRDDQALAPLAHRRFVGLKKDVHAIATDQIRRLEWAMATEKRWPAAEFHALFVDHPLLWQITRRLVWTSHTAKATAEFRIAEDRTLADAEDDTFTLPKAARVGVAHPALLGDALATWTELFADYEILQPFAQLDRPVHRLTTDERDAAALKRFHGVTVPTGRVLGLEQRGWRRAEPQEGGLQPWIARDLPDGRSVVVSLDPGIRVGRSTETPEQTIERVRLTDHRADDADGPQPDASPRFGALDPVDVSEVLGDLVGLTAPIAP